MDTKMFFNKFKKALKENALITSIVGVTWLIIGWIKSYGINSILLFPFNFISGALNGVDGGSIIGGIIGKAIVLMLLSNLLKPLLSVKRINVKKLGKSFVYSLKKLRYFKIPQYKNIRQLFTNENNKRSYNFIGFGFAFLVYPFITGNGSFQNSGVCLLIAISLFKELKKQKSLIVSIINSILKRFEIKQISKENITKIVSGNAIGFACTVVFSIFNQNNVLPYSFGIIIMFIGILELNKAKNLKVEVA